MPSVSKAAVKAGQAMGQTPAAAAVIRFGRAESEAVEPAAEPAADADVWTDDAGGFPLLSVSLPENDDSMTGSEPAETGDVGGAMIPGSGPLQRQAANETVRPTAEPSDREGSGMAPPGSGAVANDGRAGQETAAVATQGPVGDGIHRQRAGASSILPAEFVPRLPPSELFTAAAQQSAPTIAMEVPPDGSQPVAAEKAGQPPAADRPRMSDSGATDASHPAAASVAPLFPAGGFGQQERPPGDLPVAGAAGSPEAAGAFELAGREETGAPGRMAAAVPVQTDNALPARHPLPLTKTAALFDVVRQGGAPARVGSVGLEGSKRPQTLHPIEPGRALPAEFDMEPAASAEKPKAAAMEAGTDGSQRGTVREPEGQGLSPAANAHGPLPAVVDVQSFAVSAEQPDPSNAILSANAQRPAGAGIPLVSADFDSPAPHRPAGEAASVREMPVSIAKAVADGKTEVTLALRPPELGHLTIRLHFADGQLQVDIRADRPETLHLLQREADGFERSLRQAGLDVRDGGLQFSAHGDGSRQRPGNGPNHVWHGLAGEEADEMAGQSTGGRTLPDATALATSGPLPFVVSDRLDLRI